MAKKSALRPSGSTPVSQVVIAIASLAALIGAFEAYTQGDFYGIAPTQLFLLAGVLGVLGLYLKDEK